MKSLKEEFEGVFKSQQEVEDLEELDYNDYYGIGFEKGVEWANDKLKEAVLEFEKRFYNRNKPNSKDCNKKIIDLFKEIMGEYQDK